MSSLETVPVVLNLVQPPLFKVCIAEAHKILHDLHVAALARDEERRTTLPDNKNLRINFKDVGCQQNEDSG